MDIAQGLFDLLRTTLLGVLVLTVLVFVHELGHYLAARLFGMHVDAFAVMMGGVRKTQLTDRLDRPLAPAATVWVVGLVALAMTLVGALGKIPALFLTGLVICAIPLPVWIAGRLQALYHLRNSRGYLTLIKSWLGAMAVLVVATRLQGLTPSLVLGLILAGSIVGVLLVYYMPLQGREEDGPMGVGEIQTGPIGERLPVIFRPVWARRDRNGTEFSLLALPLGGFAAIRGMHPKEDGSETKIDRGFYSKSPLARFIVLFAGPFFSIAFGIVVLTSVFMVKGKAEYATTVVSSVSEKSVAESAGIKIGDRIVRVNDRPVGKQTEMSAAIREEYAKLEGSEPKEIELTIERRGETMTVRVEPQLSDKPETVLDADGKDTGRKERLPRVGISGTQVFVQLEFGNALREACMAPVNMVQNLAGVLIAPSTAKDAVGGPGSLAKATNDAADTGASAVFGLAALLSISLGVMNLLPFPPLDGGQMVVAVIEMFRKGRRLSIQVQQTVSQVGFVLVILLTIGAITMDVSRTASDNKAKAAPAKDKK